MIGKIDFSGELGFRTSRSGGAGGQHVNKVSTKVELLFDVAGSQLLTEDQKSVLAKKLKNRISNEGVLSVSSSVYRTQLANKKAVIKRFYELLEEAFRKPKRRKPTKPGKAAVEKRLKAKKIRSAKKQQRKKEPPDES